MSIKLMSEGLEVRFDGGFEPPLPCPIPYRGWNIWSWTGWKKGKTTYEGEAKFPCSICGFKAYTGDSVVLYQNKENVDHYECVHSGNVSDRPCGQWLAMRRYPNGHKRYLETSCGQGWSPCADGEYMLGQSFMPAADVSHLALITEGSTEHEKEQEIYRGLVRMFALIDSIEGPR